jgi:hypothetical protein
MGVRETLPPTLGEELRLRVFENRVLRRIFGDGTVTGEWRKLHNEELRDLYSSPSIIRMIKSRRMRCAGHVAGLDHVESSCEFGDEPLGSIEWWETFEWPHNWWPLE